MDCVILANESSSQGVIYGQQYPHISIHSAGKLGENRWEGSEMLHQRVCKYFLCTWPCLVKILKRKCETSLPLLWPQNQKTTRCAIIACNFPPTMHLSCGKMQFLFGCLKHFGSHTQSELELIIYLWLLSAIDNLISHNYCYLLCVCWSSTTGNTSGSAFIAFLSSGTGVLLTGEFMYND